MKLLVNIDVPDLARGIAFYESAFGLRVTRRLGAMVAELGGWPVPVYLLEQQAGSIVAGNAVRNYDRHWTALHLDVVVENIDIALIRAVAAGAQAETGIRVAAWGKLVTLADPFGHGLCLIEFVGRGYDELASPAA